MTRRAGAGASHGMTQSSIELIWLRRLRLASLFEGTTLGVLVCIAMPLKHLAGVPVATAIMGPIHGVAFIVYVWLTINMLSGGNVLRGGDWRRADVARLLVPAFIPFGALYTICFLRAKEAALTTPVESRAAS